MALLTSLYSGISGLQSHQQKMDVIGNNIANVNTFGFKTGRLQFEDMLSTILSQGQAPGDNLAGTNPQQIGMGSKIGSVSSDLSQGAFENTGLNSDLAIDGDGFFILEGTGNERLFTRNGAFSLSADYDLVDPTSGMKVIGYNAERLPDGTLEINNAEAVVSIPIGEMSYGQQTSEVNLSGNLNSNATIATQGSFLKSYQFYSSNAGAAAAPGTTLENLYWDPEADGTFERVFPNLNGTAGQTLEFEAKKGPSLVTDTFTYGAIAADPTGENSYDGTTLAELTTWMNNVLGLGDQATHTGSWGCGYAEFDDATDVVDIYSQYGEVNGISNIKFTDKNVTTNLTQRDLFTIQSDVNGNDIEADGENGAVTDIVVYDSLGNTHSMRLSFWLESQSSEFSTWRWVAESKDNTGTSSQNEAGRDLANGTVRFDEFGNFSPGSTNADGLVELNLYNQGVGTPLQFNLDFSNLTQFYKTENSTVNVRSQDGTRTDVLDTYSISSEGAIIGIFKNGLSVQIGQMLLADFSNPQGMVKVGSNKFAVGANSGEAAIGTPGTGGKGGIRQGMLEQSNVDLTKEFTELVTTQRAYQANARTITTSNSLLQELVQLVR